MKRSALMVLPLLAAASNADAAWITTIGWGNKTCGEFVEARRTDSVTRFTMQAWVQGYVAGVGDEAGLDVMDGQSSEAMSLFVENFCRAHPLDNILEAARSLSADLVKRAKERRSQ